jgi:serine phosphatase RsbU (regulator of sigma subunit)
MNEMQSIEAFGASTVGLWPVIKQLDAAAEKEPVLAGGSSIAIDFVLCVGALVVLGLWFAERGRREYLWLSAYLFVVGIADLSFQLSEGFLPAAFDVYPLPLYLGVPLLQVEFTYAFVGKRVPRAWRLYQAVLLAVGFGGYLINWFGLIPRIFFGEMALVYLPAAILLPVLLVLWFRRGHREAGWLIVPSLLPGLGQGLYLGWWLVSQMFQSHRLDFLMSILRFRLGGATFQLDAISNLLFLVAIGIVLFLRHTKLTQEQERTTAELQAAREIQNRLVPVELPEIVGCRVRAAYLPAAEVGGDFFQVLRQDDGSTLIAVGDVSGKGLRAAITGALAIGALRTLADEGTRPASVLSAMNRQLARAGQGGFVTLLCAKLDTDGKMTLANAGHLYPYRNGLEMAVDTGMPLGLAEGAEYGETTVHLEPGDDITFLSDGVVEARKPNGELFGFERTQAISRRDPQEIADAAQEFGQEDDITVVTMTLAPAEVLD